MDKQMIFTNRFVSIYYEIESATVSYKYVGTFETSLGLEGHKFVMDFAKKNNVESVIFNASEMKGTFTSLTGFMKNEYTPTMEKNGLRFAAFILNSKDVFLKFAFNQIVKLLNTKIQIKAFNSLSEGESWLSQNIEASAE